MSPKTGAGAGVGVGMLRGEGGFPQMRTKRFQGFVVYRVLGFFISKVQSSRVPKFRSFKDSKNANHRKILISYYQHSISCFLDDVDPIFKIFRKYYTDLHDVRRPSFPIFSTKPIYDFDIFKQDIC